VRRGRGAWRFGGHTEARPTVSDSNGVAKLNLIRPGHMSAMPTVVTHISAALTIGGPLQGTCCHTLEFLISRAASGGVCA
jgi:hypothetical protein